ncbi:MAG: gamma-glutamyl-gamma-aminobutyrate hydrolase family protein [Crocinitomicaceae bacterium]|nr:gamma-glutamyl-gamma-aminobutyrate hydrolase family protein [Crocinitomicaceae bacterium]
MILVIDCGSTKTKYIEQIVDEYMDVKPCKLMDFTSDDLKDIKGVIISGAPLLVTELDMTPYLEKLAWIKTTELPVFGICFGHQIIGILHDAFASRIREDRDWQTVEHFIDSPIFNRLPDEVQMMEDHCETISIPANFELVAASDACVNEAMQHLTKPIYGVQFHPEVSGNHGSIIIENFVNLCLEERFH